VKPKTYDQLRCIWGIAHQLHIEPDDLRDQVAELFPATGGHLSQLTAEQAAQLINLLKQKAGQPVKPYRTGRQPRDQFRPFMSPGQCDKAFIIACEIKERELGTKSAEPEAWRLLDTLAERDGAKSFDTCNTRQAAHVIEALKAMKERLPTPPLTNHE